MTDIKHNAIVLRAGMITETNLRDAHNKKTLRIEHDDVVSNMSVQVWNDNVTSFKHKPTLLKLLEAVPNRAYALTRAHDVTEAGGSIRWNKLRDNPYHALVSGLTVGQIVRIFGRNQYEDFKRIEHDRFG